MTVMKCRQRNKWSWWLLKFSQNLERFYSIYMNLWEYMQMHILVYISTNENNIQVPSFSTHCWQMWIWRTEPCQGYFFLKFHHKISAGLRSTNAFTIEVKMDVSCPFPCMQPYPISDWGDLLVFFSKFQWNSANSNERFQNASLEC